MDPKRWEKIQQVFHDALERPQTERPAFVSSACADDARMEREVLALLTEDGSAESMLDRGVGAAADAVIDRAWPVPSSIACSSH